MSLAAKAPQEVGGCGEVGRSPEAPVHVCHRARGERVDVDARAALS